MRILLIVGLLTLVSCGKPEVEYVVKPASQENYTYELKEKHCSTGVQSFETMVDTCDALKNDKKNNYCAKSEREELFINHSCVGSFSE